jgi:hypothetical protein
MTPRRPLGYVLRRILGLRPHPGVPALAVRRPRNAGCLARAGHTLRIPANDHRRRNACQHTGSQEEQGRKPAAENEAGRTNGK